jgi:hypothetical protein
VYEEALELPDCFKEDVLASFSRGFTIDRLGLSNLIPKFSSTLFGDGSVGQVKIVDTGMRYLCQMLGLCTLFENLDQNLRISN